MLGQVVNEVHARVEQLGVRLSEQFDALMQARGLTHRTLSWRSGRSGNSTVGRAMKGGNLRMSTIVSIANALDADVEIIIRPRVSSPSAPVSQDKPLPRGEKLAS